MIFKGLSMKQIAKFSLEGESPTLINHQQDIAKIYLYTKDPSEEKYQLLINKHEKMA